MSNDTKKECNCVEKSCTNTCTKKHTCHVFWCEKCEPQRCEDMRAVPSKNPMEEECGACCKFPPKCKGKDCKCHQPQEEDWENPYLYLVNERTKRLKEAGVTDYRIDEKSLIEEEILYEIIKRREMEARQEERERIMKTIQEKQNTIRLEQFTIDTIIKSINTNES